MEINSTNTTITTQNVSETKSELEILGSGLQGGTAMEEQRKAQLMQHMKDLKDSNQGWLNRLMLSKEDKDLLRLQGEKELEAAETVLGDQNKALMAICEGQLKFIKEVVNTLLYTARSGLKGGATAIYLENSLALKTILSKISDEFYTMIENMQKDAETRPAFVRKQMLEVIDLMMIKRKEDIETIVNDFSTILKEKV